MLLVIVTLWRYAPFIAALFSVKLKTKNKSNTSWCSTTSKNGWISRTARVVWLIGDSRAADPPRSNADMQYGPKASHLTYYREGKWRFPSGLKRKYGRSYFSWSLVRRAWQLSNKSTILRPPGLLLECRYSGNISWTMTSGTASCSAWIIRMQICMKRVIFFCCFLNDLDMSSRVLFHIICQCIRLQKWKAFSASSI